jgi:hypothetical protein
MKKLLLAAACFLSLHSAFAQGYVPMPDTLATWVQAYEAGWGPMGNIYYRVNISTAGKVIVNNTTYVELRKSGYGKPVTTSPVETYNNELYGYYRSDTTTGKVFFRAAISDTDRVLYDFSLQVGDSIPLTTIWGYPGLVIDSVDIVWMDGHARRRLMFWDYSFIPGTQGAIIEGIGNVHGLGWELALPYEPAMASLECYSHGDSIYKGFVAPPQFDHPFSTSVACVLYNDVSEPLEESMEISISNPVTNQLLIQANMSSNSQLVFKLYNSLGQQVISTILNTTTTILPRNALPNGIYYWQVESAEKAIKAGKLLFH